MNNFLSQFGLYVHIPWCVKKCPYCDFNSHEAPPSLKENQYLKSIISDFTNDYNVVSGRNISSIYIGGGTPTILSPNFYESLLSFIYSKANINDEAEITIEANPGTIDLKKALALRSCGVNRVSIGVQSFQNERLKAIGRIHDSEVAVMAVNCFKEAGFDNFNIDLMYGLPSQTISDALYDLEKAISLNPTHISWYQLTIEPNTAFYSSNVVVPCEDIVFDMQVEGKKLLANEGFEQYEISAYSKSGFQCRHNLNYWLFGDYLGIGAGAHGKITQDLSCDKRICEATSKKQIRRYFKIERPEEYLTACNSYEAGANVISDKDILLEFMLNALRLFCPIPLSLFSERTGLEICVAEDVFKEAKKQGLMQYDGEFFMATSKGRNFLNDLLLMFVEIF